MTTMDRRRFLQAVAATSAGVALGPMGWRQVFAAPTTSGDGPYGPLAQKPDPNGLLLPAGFTSRVIARSGEEVANTGYVWPAFPDGAATFPAPGGGWYYAVNSEVLLPLGHGGASAIHFDASGGVVDAYRILAGTTGNCAGGPTPWGTWLSCEETHSPSHVGEGRVWECDPSGANPGQVRPALGSFNHEAVAVDPVGKRLYLTEDRSNGLFYRFTPRRYPSLDEGVLEAAKLGKHGAVEWIEIPDPFAGHKTTRSQVVATRFDGGEGCWYDAGFVYFTTKGDNRVWVHDIQRDRITVLYDAGHYDNPPLTGVDNIVVAPSGDLFVAEDGGDMEICIVTPHRVVAPFLRYPGNERSEITGPVFDPSGMRLYFSSQRGPAPIGRGITFEVTGPFRQDAPRSEQGGARPPAVAGLDGLGR